MTEAEAHIAELESRIAAGPRKFDIGGVYGHVVPHGVAQVRGRLPVSRTLPRARWEDVKGKEIRYGHKVYALKDGTYADLHGRRIVGNKQDEQKQAAVTGYRLVD